MILKGRLAQSWRITVMGADGPRSGEMRGVDGGPDALTSPGMVRRYNSTDLLQIEINK